jgi:multicomponent Na+:H+ antiporter subunit D
MVAHAVNEAGSGGAVVAVHWTPLGILRGFVPTLPAVGLAAVAVTRPELLAAPDRALPLRRLQSGHVGDYVAWLLGGATLLGVLTLPGVPAT